MDLTLVSEALAGALQLHRSGQLEQAEAQYRAILAACGDHADAMQLLGSLRYQRGDHSAAVEWLRRAIALQPGLETAHANLSIVLRAAGRGQEAVEACHTAMELLPRSLLILKSCGATLSQLQMSQEALAAVDRALALAPADTQILHDRGVVLLQLRRYEEGLQAFLAVLAQTPSARAHGNVGNALRLLGRHEAALACYNAALALDPHLLQVIGNRAFLLDALGRLDEADNALEHLVAVDPAHHLAVGKLLYIRRQRCDWRMHDALVQQVCTGVAAGQPVITPFALLSVTGDPALQLACAQVHTVRDFGGTSLSPAALPWPRKPRPRVAYVSADFKQHPMAHLMSGVFEAHDRGRMEAVAISLAPAEPSPAGQRLQAAFSHFIDVSAHNDQEVVRLMCDLQIDIAVDLMGFTQGARPGIFALRAAPVQVNYLGYPGTTGSRYADYLLADRYLVPEAQRSCYGEAVVYLPGCFQANDDRRVAPGIPPARTAVGLPEVGFVFCSFNAGYKIDPLVFGTWMELLRQVPSSVLWLVADRPEVATHLAREAAGQNVDPARLVFAPRVDYAQHLARLQLADLFLDTFPFNAGTSASDALWAGVPVLTLSGASYASRMAGSLLQTAGLPELVVGDIAAYRARALELAASPGVLRGLRQRLAAHRHAPGGVFDTQAFTRRLEAAYDTMYQRCAAGIPPASFEVIV